MSIDSNLHIVIGADKHGWSSVSFVGDRATVVIGISHVFSDPLRDLANAGIGLLDGKEVIEFALYDEPGGSHIAFRKASKNFNGYELVVSDLNSEYGQCIKVGKSLLSVIVDSKYMAVQIFGELLKVKMCMKDKDYSADRKHMTMPDTFHELEKRLTNR